MGRMFGGRIGALSVPGESVYPSGFYDLSSQQKLQGASRWNPIYEKLTDFLIVGTGQVNLTFNNDISSANMFKTSSANVWDTSVRGTTPYVAPCTIEFNKMATSPDNSVSYAMIGWNTDPTTNDSYNTIDYASYPYITTSYEVYNNGAAIAVGTSWSTSSKFYIVYTTAGHIKHYNGSTLLYTQTGYGASNTVYFDTSLYSVNATFGGFSNVRIVKKEWNGSTYV